MDTYFFTDQNALIKYIRYLSSHQVRHHSAQLTRRHEVPEHLWNNNAFFGLVILQDGTHHARGGAHGCVQHVHEICLQDTQREEVCEECAATDGVKHLPLREMSDVVELGPHYGRDPCQDARNRALTLSIIFLVCP